MDFLKTQKNQLAEMITRHGFRISDFIWDEAESRFMGDDYGPALVPKLIYKSSEYHFIFDTRNGKAYNYFSPGEKQLYESSDSGSWDTQLFYFEWWIQYLKREIDAPDLWEDLLESSGFNKSVDYSEVMLSVEEQKEIVQRIENAKIKLLEEYKLDDNQIKSINEKLDYLIEATEKQSKFNWRHIARSVCISIAIEIGKNSQEAKSAFETLGTIIGDFLNIGAQNMPLIPL